MTHPILFNGLGSPQSIYKSQTTQVHPVGTLGFAQDGRRFRYACNRNAVATTAGHILKAPTTVANHLNVAQATSGTSVEIGMTEINVDIGATGINLGDYDEGVLYINDVTGQGYSHRIRTHGGSSAGSEAVAFTLYDPIQVAWDATTQVTLRANQWLDLAASTTAALKVAGGVGIVVPAGSADESATARATAPYFYWVQTAGPFNALAGAVASAAIGGAAVSSLVTAGSVDQAVAATILSQEAIGTWLDTGVSTEFKLVDLKID